MAKNEWENNGSGFRRASYSLYKKLRQFIFRTHLLTCLKNDKSVLLINI